MARAEQLLDGDGAVRVPARLASPLFAILWRHYKAQQRDSGGELSPDAHALLMALHRAASGGVSATPAPAPATVDPARVMGVAEAADVLGCNPSYVRRLCHAGRIPAQRITGGWVIEAAALDDYRHGRTAHAHEESHARRGRQLG